jgi:hypothetical protein
LRVGFMGGFHGVVIPLHFHCATGTGNYLQASGSN